MLEHEYTAKGAQRVHHHVMQKTLFISFLAMHPMVEEEGVKNHATHHAKSGSYDQFYHYDIDKTKCQRIEIVNQKNALNAPSKSLHVKR